MVIAPSPNVTARAGDANASSTLAPRVSTTKACGQCREKKSRCDGKRPCYRCRSRRLDCVFEERQHQSKDDLRRELGALKELRRHSDDLLEALKSPEHSKFALQGLWNQESILDISKALSNRGFPQSPASSGGPSPLTTTSSAKVQPKPSTPSPKISFHATSIGLVSPESTKSDVSGNAGAPNLAATRDASYFSPHMQASPSTGPTDMAVGAWSVDSSPLNAQVSGNSLQSNLPDQNCFDYCQFSKPYTPSTPRTLTAPFQPDLVPLADAPVPLDFCSSPILPFILSQNVREPMVSESLPTATPSAASIDEMRAPGKFSNPLPATADTRSLSGEGESKIDPVNPSLEETTRASPKERHRLASGRHSIKVKQACADLQTTKVEVEARNTCLRKEYYDTLDEVSAAKSALLEHAYCHDPAIEAWWWSETVAAAQDEQKTGL